MFTFCLNLCYHGILFYLPFSLSCSQIRYKSVICSLPYHRAHFEASVFQQMQALFLEAHIVLINSGDDFPITETQHVMGTRRP